MNRSGVNPMDSINPVVTRTQFAAMQERVNHVFMNPEIAKYIVSLVAATRNSELIMRGASPRATLSLAQMARASAFASNRDYVVPKDVSNVFLPTLCHRIILSATAETRRMTAEQILTTVLRNVAPPRV